MSNGIEPDRNLHVMHCKPKKFTPSLSFPNSAVTEGYIGIPKEMGEKANTQMGLNTAGVRGVL